MQRVVLAVVVAMGLCLGPAAEAVGLKCKTADGRDGYVKAKGSALGRLLDAFAIMPTPATLAAGGPQITGRGAFLLYQSVIDDAAKQAGQIARLKAAAGFGDEAAEAATQAFKGQLHDDFILQMLRNPNEMRPLDRVLRVIDTTVGRDGTVVAEPARGVALSTLFGEGEITLSAAGGGFATIGEGCAALPEKKEPGPKLLKSHGEEEGTPEPLASHGETGPGNQGTGPGGPSGPLGGQPSGIPSGGGMSGHPSDGTSGTVTTEEAYSMYTTNLPPNCRELWLYTSGGSVIPIIECY